MNKKEKKARFLDSYYKLKNGNFAFGKIERYFLRNKNNDVHQIISDSTYKDLDLDEVFKLIDRTISGVGQQYLYNLLRTIPDDNKRAERIEFLIKVFRENPEIKESVLLDLQSLNNNDAFNITSLLFDKYILKPNWFPVIKILSFTSFSCAILSFFFPQFIIALVLLLAVNFGIHYWNKINLYTYGSSIPQLLKLNQTAARLLEFGYFSKGNGSLQKSTKMLDSASIPMSIFKIEARLQSEIGLLIEHVIEIIKALFLIEPLILFRTLDFLDSKRQNMLEIFDFVAEIDAAISINSLRETLPYFCIPTLDTSKKKLNLQEAYHPLIYDAVSNDIIVNSKSVLLTGSNMSGKSTFIRTVGINAIVGQSINTCFAKKYEIPKIKIHSSIRISDDLLSEKSYYFEEVLTIKNLLEQSKSESGNLFLLDEIFKGTNTIERIAAGKSVLSYLNKNNNIVFVSTHDLELAEHLAETYDLYHFSEIIENDDILFDYKIKSGNLTSTNAIRILELNNYPQEVINEAIELADHIKKTKLVERRQ